METRKNNKQNIPHKSSRKKGLSVMSGVVPSMFSIGIIKKKIAHPAFPQLRQRSGQVQPFLWQVRRHGTGRSKGGT